MTYVNTNTVMSTIPTKDDDLFYTVEEGDFVNPVVRLGETGFIALKMVGFFITCNNQFSLPIKNVGTQNYHSCMDTIVKHNVRIGLNRVML